MASQLTQDLVTEIRTIMNLIMDCLDAPVSTATPNAGCNALHHSRMSSHGHALIYDLYNAALHGCYSCVRRLVIWPDSGFDALHDVDIYGWSVLDYALWGQMKNINVGGDYESIITFLTQLGVPSNRLFP